MDPTKQAVDYDHFPLERLGRTHFIGIGGAGMSVLAEMLLEKGIPVSGSDRAKIAPPTPYDSESPSTMIERITMDKSMAPSTPKYPNAPE